jgi:arylsulfatase
MATRPDLVLFMTDQQRYDWVGYASDGHFETPNLDRLASQGTTFEHAYSGDTTCVPARVALLTGLHNWETVPHDDNLALQEGYWTVAHALREAGYETALIGRMHFWPPRSNHGFDLMRMCENISPGSGYPLDVVDDYGDWLRSQGRPDWRLVRPWGEDGEILPFNPGMPGPWPDEPGYHSTEWIAREATEFLRRRDSTKPLFLIVSFPHPHGPYDPPEPWASMYRIEDARMPTDGFEVNDGLPESTRNALAADGWAHPHRVNADDPRVERGILTAIRGLVRHIDDAMGRILDDIDLSSTVVFFTSDHGDFGGHRGLMNKIPWIAFDDLARVPLVVAGYDTTPGRRVQELVQSCDFTLTCLDYAGVDPPDAVFRTRSLRPLVTGAPDRGPLDESHPLYCAVRSLQMIRRGRYKYLPTGREEGLLFDLVADPGETVDLFPSHGELAAELREILREERRRPPQVLPRFD